MHIPSSVAQRRTVLLSLLLVAALAVPTLALASGASATPVAETAKKKCKKGYKRKKGKCKKVGPKVSKISLIGALSGIGLPEPTLSAGGTVTFKDLLLNREPKKPIEITYVTPTTKFEHTVKTQTANDIATRPFGEEFVYTGDFPVTITARADGKTSNTVKVYENGISE